MAQVAVFYRLITESCGDPYGVASDSRFVENVKGLVGVRFLGLAGATISVVLVAVAPAALGFLFACVMAATWCSALEPEAR